MSKSSAVSKIRSKNSSSVNIPLEPQYFDLDKPNVESSHQTEQPRSTLDFSDNQESGDATKPDLGLLVDDLRIGMSTMSMKVSDPVDIHASSSSRAVLDDAPKLYGILDCNCFYHSDDSIQFPIVRQSSGCCATAEEGIGGTNPRKAKKTTSNPRIERGVELTWPLIQYATRRSDGHLWPMLFFDITRDPSDPTAGAISLHYEGNQEIQEGLLSECMKLAFSPTTKFSMIKLKGKENELDGLEDVVVNRPDGIRVIDIFSAIFKAYNVPLTLRETFYLHDLLNSMPSIDAYHRRSKPLPIQDRDVFRVDLLGKKTIFNGISFDEETGQFYFRLIEPHPDDITLTALY
ncbi:hypothetical protein C0993_006206 [Termitomyces sp. T159_Od127]|nr:hypothetical protein C0993_006206 [Termitomyces sp. T159_Od127]